MELIDVLINVAQASVMFTIGLALTQEDFKSLVKHPRAVAIGLSLQFLFLPVVAFLVAIAFRLPPSFQVGIIILSLCPGGTLSNFMSYLFKADVALSVSLTTINSLLILLTIPFGTNLALEYFMGDHREFSLSFWETALQIMLVVIIPLLIGMYWRAKSEEWAAAVRRPLSIVNMIMLAIVFGVKFFAGQSVGGSGITQSEVIQLFPPTLTMHLMAMIGSYIISRWVLGHAGRSTTIGIEVGLQNTTLALMITSTLLKNNAMSLPILTFAIFSFFTTAIFAWLIRPRTA